MNLTNHFPNYPQLHSPMNGSDFGNKSACGAAILQLFIVTDMVYSLTFYPGRLQSGEQICRYF